jgi:hypothetical protein
MAGLLLFGGGLVVGIRLRFLWWKAFLLFWGGDVFCWDTPRLLMSPAGFVSGGVC